MYDPGSRAAVLGGLGVAGGTLATTGFSTALAVVLASLMVIGGFVLLRAASQRRAGLPDD